jgi:hypothetical protein
MIRIFVAAVALGLAGAAIACAQAQRADTPRVEDELRIVRPKGDSSRDEQAIQRAVVQAITVQLRANGCWTEQSNVLEGRDNVILFGLRFGRDGKLVDAPQGPVVKDDPVLQGFVERARDALKKCDAIGFRLPETFLAAPGWVFVTFEARPE